jgi:hypothetical protein
MQEKNKSLFETISSVFTTRVLIGMIGVLLGFLLRMIADRLTGM